MRNAHEKTTKHPLIPYILKPPYKETKSINILDVSCWTPDSYHSQQLTRDNALSPRLLTPHHVTVNPILKEVSHSLDNDNLTI